MARPRAGKKAVTFYLDEEYAKLLYHLAVEAGLPLTHFLEKWTKEGFSKERSPRKASADRPAL